MKKILFIIMIMLTVTITGQEREREKNRGDKMERFKDFSAEEIAQLRTKKLALTLDLSSEQQSKVNALVLKQAKDMKMKREKRKDVTKKEKPSKEERLAKMNQRLDDKIAAKAEMKKILNEEQFTKWEKIHARKGMKKKRMRKQKVRSRK